MEMAWVGHDRVTQWGQQNFCLIIYVIERAEYCTHIDTIPLERLYVTALRSLAHTPLLSDGTKYSSLDPFLRGVTFLATEGLDDTLVNKANQQYHFKRSQWRMELLLLIFENMC